MSSSEIKRALKGVRPGKAIPLPGGSSMHKTRVYPRPPRPGPAWTMHYHFVDPAGMTWGGWTYLTEAVRGIQRLLARQ